MSARYLINQFIPKIHSQERLGTTKAKTIVRMLFILVSNCTSPTVEKDFFHQRAKTYDLLIARYVIDNFSNIDARINDWQAPVSSKSCTGMRLIEPVINVKDGFGWKQEATPSTVASFIRLKDVCRS